MKTLKKFRGITLIELMVVVLIMAILSAIAYPNYANYVRKGRRGDAQAALMDAAKKLEIYFARNATYTTAEGDVDVDTISTEGYYDIVIQAANAGCPVTSCYRLRATTRNTGGQNKDKIWRFRLWSDGRKQHRLQAGGWVAGWVVH